MRAIHNIYSPGKANCGFTIFEIIVALVIIGIVSAVAVSRLSSTDTYNLASETEILKSHLRYAQSRAMSDTVSWGIVFSGSSYTLQTDGSTATTNLPNEDSPTHSLQEGVIANCSAVAFDQFGSPVPLGAGTTIKLSAGGNSRSITVTPNTGFIP